ncbi:hypothetical protein [Actinosynnema sp. ALI-1.44]|uniref:hypothetical protein n=1 Tax=Actinosynnema sp. ALI-1.44 TaxID=1933779 RepID=UPI0011779696|nr:hypothetical protein [Actinosynnema sp. ALI-1.44]
MQTTTKQPDDTEQAPPTGVPDPADQQPLCDADEFDELILQVVANEAPRVFAVVAEYGTRVDARCVAWGMAFEKAAYAVSIDGRRQFLLENPDAALKYFKVVGSVTTRLVWSDPGKVLPPEPEED